MDATVFLGLGSNLDDRAESLLQALELLGDSLRLEAISSSYETEPWGYAGQPRFLNAVCQATTHLPPGAVVRLAKLAELRLGRRPTFPNGPRVIDVDILAYGDAVIDAPDLVIPHPRLQERAFVLVPWAEIAPGWVHPRIGQTVGEMLEQVASSGTIRGVRLWGPPLVAPAGQAPKS